jgi:hypothetical protein
MQHGSGKHTPLTVLNGIHQELMSQGTVVEQHSNLRHMQSKNLSTAGQFYTSETTILTPCKHASKPQFPVLMARTSVPTSSTAKPLELFHLALPSKNI